MKIALTHPFCWPYVRRGAERFLAELATYLTAQGHEVWTLASKPGASLTQRDETGTRILKRQICPRALQRVRLHPAHAFAANAYWELRKLRVDLVQSLHFMDALGSELARKAARHKSIYYITGPPIPNYQPRLPPDRWFLKQAILRADAVAVPSEYVASIVSRYYGVESTVLPVPVDSAHFSPDPAKRSERPLILWIGSVDVARKGVSELIRAFVKVKRERPDAMLRICAQIDSESRRKLLALAPADVASEIEFPGLGTLEELPDHYRAAWVTVQPAKWESYSLVLLESWACGTPVVAVRHGALPELVTAPGLGALFDPGGSEDQVGIENLNGLAMAVTNALSAPVPAEQAQICRRKAEGYSWEALGPSFLAFYAQVLLKTPGGFRAK